MTYQEMCAFDVLYAAYLEARSGFSLLAGVVVTDKALRHGFVQDVIGHGMEHNLVHERRGLDYLEARSGKRKKVSTAQYEANALACTEKLSRILASRRDVFVVAPWRRAATGYDSL